MSSAGGRQLRTHTKNSYSFGVNFLVGENNKYGRHIVLSDVRSTLEENQQGWALEVPGVMGSLVFLGQRRPP